MTKLTLTIAFSAALLWTGAAGAQDASNGNADNGKSLFMKDGCYECHNPNAQGGGAGPRLAPDPLPFDAFLRQLRTPAQEMPPYEQAILSDQQAADIHAFLATIPASPDWKTIPLLSGN
jgi:ubiquinol-cytochrome c reductase cytochrome c subunit